MPEIEIVLSPWLPGPGDKWGEGQSSKGGAVEASDPAAKWIIAAIQNASKRDVSSGGEEVGLHPVTVSRWWWWQLCFLPLESHYSVRFSPGRKQMERCLTCTYGAAAGILAAAPDPGLYGEIQLWSRRGMIIQETLFRPTGRYFQWCINI